MTAREAAEPSTRLRCRPLKPSTKYANPGPAGVPAAIVGSEEVQPGVILDFDAQSRVVGAEIPGLGDRVPEAMLRTLQFETT